MTTVLADARLGVMVSDSSASDGTRVWVARKVWRVRGHLLGFAGSMHHFKPIVDWFRFGSTPEEVPNMGDASVLILGPTGLYLMDHNSKLPQYVESGREAIGAGAQSAIAVHEALGWADPRRAVRIVCKHDATSRPPVRLYRLAGRRP
ncbi:MAG TPA: hypothetical protein PLN55_09920 [Burkholderiaceae bacterium]|nr:hypothetical protein [Burkholderiaceae bacterium]